MTDDLTYEDGASVDLFDHVEALVDGLWYSGQIYKIWPRAGDVRVRYRNHYGRLTRKGEEPTKTARVSIRDVVLQRRDG